MFEQVLVSMLGMDTSDDERDAKLERAFKKLHDLTEGVHTALLKNRVFESLNAVVEDADIDALDEEIARSESTKAKNEETAAPASHEDSLRKAAQGRRPFALRHRHRGQITAADISATH